MDDELRWIDRADRPAVPPGLDQAIRFFETLSPQSLDALEHVYAPDARFRDPFNDLRGHAAITAVFEHMFAQLDNPRFIVCDAFGDAHQGFVTWEFRFGFRRGAPRGMQLIRGSTHFRFDPQGRVLLHRDYWDAAEELYAKLPVLGALMRWLRRKLQIPASGHGVAHPSPSHRKMTG